MPFQISELVIRVTTDSPDGAVVGQEAVSECRKGGHTCLPNVTDCRKGGSTCAPPNAPSDCRKGGVTCADVPSNCGAAAVTCAPPKSSSQRRQAELDFVLQQIRDAVTAETADDEDLVTA
jgi:hypothetical protein